MDLEQAKEQLKDKLPDYLDRAAGRVPNREGKFLCINPEHADHRPSMGFYTTDKGEIRAKCFSCGKNYNLFSAIGAVEGLATFRDQLRRAADLYGIQLDEPNHTATMQAREIHDGETIPAEYFTPTESAPAAPAADLRQPEPPRRGPKLHDLFRQWGNNIYSDQEALDYLTARGFKETTIGNFCIGSGEGIKTSDGKTWHAITIPTSDYSYMLRNLDTSAEKKDRYRGTEGEPRHLYPVEFIKKNEKADLPFIVCEGELDALAIIQSGGNGLSMGGAENRGRLVSFLQDPTTRNGRPIIIALDNDDAGRRAAEDLRKDLATIAGIVFYEVDIAGEFKDPAERLEKDPEGLAEAVAYCNAIEENKKREAAEKYRREQSATGKMSLFHAKIAENKKTGALSTGFKNIDEAMDGGLYPGLYTVGAISGAGKTTLVLQIGENIAAAGKDVLIFSLEMATEDLIAKALSRHTYEISQQRNMPFKYARTIRDVLLDRADSDTSRALLEDAEAEYLKYSDHIYIVEGMMDYGPNEISAAIEKHAQMTGEAPVIIVDYLQILTPTDPHQTDKQKTDEAVKRMKQTSRKHNVPIIVISSFNRDNYTGAVNMAAFKESGAIEYSSDVLLGLQLAGMDKKRDETDKEYKARIADLTDPDKKKERRKQGRPDVIEMKILKARTDQTGKVKLDFYPPYNCYKDHIETEIHDDDIIDFY